MLTQWLMGVALAGTCAPGIDEYRHDVTIASVSTGRVEETYRFSVPPADCSHIDLPREMDGFVVSGSDLQVREGRLIRKSQWAEGDVVLVSASAALGRGPHSGEVLRPDFEVGTMAVQVTIPSYARLSVWAAPHGRVSVDANRTKTYRAVFSGGGRLVWSMDRDWWAVGDRLRTTINGRLASKYQLGAMGEGITTLSVADILKRVSTEIALDPLGADWKTSRPASVVLREKRGSVAERSLVLLSLLRAAGYEANPVLVRPVSAADIPLVVPADGLFTRFAIRVLQENGPDIWLDPGSPYSQPDSVPRELRGATVLEPGDLPHPIHDGMVPDGKVVIRSTAVLSETGSLEIVAEVTAEDGATQAVRDVLGPLPKSTRKQWLSDLLRVVRPGLEDLRFQVFGVEDPAYPFGMTMEFDNEAALRQLGAGLAGPVPAVLAPQLARVLPPNIEIVETLVVKGTDTLELYGVRPVEDPVDDAVILNRSMVSNGKAVELTTRALRPWRTSPRASETERILDEASLRGPELVFFGLLDRAAARALQKEVTNSDTRVMEGLLWYRAGDEEEAEKALRRAVRTGRIRAVSDALRRYAERGDYRPWNVVWDAVDSDHDRLALVEGLEAKNELREAWRRASLLVASDDPAVQIAALVAVAKVQGQKPAANIDELAHKAWREPTLLLAKAEKLSQNLAPGVGDPAIDVAFAERLLARGLCKEAGPKVERAAKQSNDPLTRAVYEEWRVCSGTAGEPEDLEALMVESTFDPTVMRSAVRIWTRQGEARRARRWAVLAALIEGDDAEMWSEAMHAAMLAGDLDTAVYAARQASDLKPASMTAGVPLQILATLAGDEAAAELATKRSSYQVSIEPFPISIDTALSFMEEDHQLGFLRRRDAEVLASEELLTNRYRRNLASGFRMESARDAGWLAKAFKLPTAVVDVYLTTSDRVWSTHSLEPLNRAVRDLGVRKLRMETALLTGTADPVVDTNYLKGDPAAELIREARYKGSSLAKRKNWPSGLSNPKIQVPPGYRTSRLLSTMKGVVGYTNAAAGSTLLVSAAGDLLPPPLEGPFRLGGVLESNETETVYALEGGVAPGFVAKRTLGDLTFWGAARTEQLARHALESGINAQSVQ